MAKKIKKKIKITPSTRYAMSLALAVAPQYGPEREKPYPFSFFYPPTLFTDYFTEQFNVELVAANRFVALEEFSRWVTAVRPGEAMKGGLKTGYIDFPAPREESFPEYLLLPIIGAATETDWEEQIDQWTEGLSEIQTTVFRRLIEPELGIVPGVDKCLFMGPCDVREINQVILYLHGRVSDECRLSRWPVPPLFPILDFKVVDRLPLKTPISF